MRIRRRSVKKGRVELIPLIDTILMLLIFYMTFGKMIKEESKLDATLPVFAESSSSDATEMSNMTVEVTGKGNLLVNNEEQTLDGFAETLSGLALVADTVSVVLKGKDDVYYQDMIDVLNICAKNGIKNVSFMSSES